MSRPSKSAGFPVCTKQLPSVLLILFTVTTIGPTAVVGACCTAGQPVYQGRLFATPSGPSPNAGILNFITCSDGPCTGTRNGVYFDYVSADAKESDTPDSCCNIDGLDPNGFSPYLYFYNPQLANGSASTRNTSWLGDLGLIFNNGSYFPGTGLTCNRTLPKYKCVLGTIGVPTCHSVYGTNATACGADRVYDSSQADIRSPSRDVCCRARTCLELADLNVSCSSGFKYNEASNNTNVTSSSNFTLVCCQMKTCADIEDSSTACPVGFGYNETLTGSRSAINNNFTSDCCKPVAATCKDVDPQANPGQQFSCDESIGWQYDPRNGNVTSPAQEACCVQSSCADVFPLNNVPNEPWNCSEGYKLKGNLASIRPASETNCCERETCADQFARNISCPSGLTYNAIRVNNTSVTTNFTSDCCEAEEAGSSTCGDMDGDRDTTDPWPCVEEDGWVANASAVTQQMPSNTTCCARRTCADTEPFRADTQRFNCTQADWVYDQSSDTASPPTEDNCCKAAAAICKQPDPAAPGVPFACDVTNGWQYDPSKENVTDPSEENCCVQSSCADVFPLNNVPIEPWSCSEGYKLKDNPASIKSASEANCCERETCGDQFARNISCPSGLTYNATRVNNTQVTTNFTRDCCEAEEAGSPTCGDMDGDRSTTDPWPCVEEDGWVTNTSAETQQMPSNTTCCVRQTCADTEPFQPGRQQFNCTRADWVYDRLSDTNSPPSEDTCCKPGMTTCGDWNLRGDPYPCNNGTFLNEANRQLPGPTQQTCCACNCTDGPFTIVKSGPEQVGVGEAFKYNLVVAFFGAASGVVVTDNLPKELRPSLTTPATWVARSVLGVLVASGDCQTATDNIPDDAAPEFTCNLQGLSCKPGDVVEIEVPVIAGTEPSTGPVVNWAYVTDDQNRTANDNATVITRNTQIQSQVPFVITKLGPGNVTAGQEFTFGITVTFLDDVTGAIIRDTLPNGLTRGSSAATWVGYSSARVQRAEGSCTVSDVPPDFTCPLGNSNFTWKLGDTVELSIPAVATGLVTRNLQNTATVTDSRNRTAEDTASVNVTTVDSGLGFMVIKSGPGTITVGQVATFRVNVVFFGRTTGVTVVDNLPTPLKPVSSNPPTWGATVSGSRSNGGCTASESADPEVTCSFSSLTFNAGDTIDLTVPVVTTQPAAGVLTNIALVTDDRNRNSNSTANVTIIEEAQPVAVFVINKVCPGSAPQNEIFTCEITVVFTSRTSGVVITDDLPVGLISGGRATWTGFNAQIVQLASGECAPGSIGGPEFSCNLTGVPGGQWNPQERVVVRVPVVGTVVGAGYVNVANVTDSANRTASDDARVDITAPNAPFVLVKSGPGTAYVNQPFSFRVSVLFFSTVFGVVITDDLPAGLLVPSNTTQISWAGVRAAGGSTTSGFCTVNAQSPEYTCDLGANVWSNGDRVEVSVPAVAPSTATNLINNATVRDSQNRVSWDTAAVSVVSLDTPRLLVNKFGPGAPCNLNTPFTFTVAAGVYPGSPPVNPLILVDELQTTDAKFVDPIPPNCTKRSDQRMECRWNETVGPADTKLLKFYVIGTKPGLVVNNAIVSSPGVLTMNDTAEATICNCPTNTSNPPDVDKQGPGLPVREGQIFNWTITADVPGPNKPVNMTLTDQIPANTGFVFTGVVLPAALNCPTKQPNLIVCVLFPPFPQTVTIQSNATRAGLWSNFVELRTVDSVASDNSTAPVVIEPPVAPSPSPSSSPAVPVSPAPSPSPDMFVPTCARYTRDGRSWVEAEGGCAPPAVYNPALSGNSSNMTAPNIGAPWVTICCTTAAQSAPVVNIRKSVDKERYDSGQTGTYTIVVTSDSLDTPALGVSVQDTVPAGLTPITDSWRVVNRNNQQTQDTCSFVGRQLTCNLGEMSQDTSNPSQTKTITFRFTVGVVAFPTFIENTAWVYCTNTLPGSPLVQPNCLGRNDSVIIQVDPRDTPVVPENTVQVQATAFAEACANRDMTVTVVADPGLSTATGVTVVTSCGSKVTIKRVTSPREGCRIQDNRITCTFARLARPSTITFQVSGSSAGRYTCTARARVRGNTRDINRGSASGRILAANNRACVTQVTGACCVNAGSSSRQCTNSVTESTCTGRGGQWRQNTRCSTDWCPAAAPTPSPTPSPAPPPAGPDGQCCRFAGTEFAACTVAKQAQCSGWGTRWQVGTVNGQCASAFCPGRAPTPTPTPPVNCQCQSCGFPGAQWPTNCCSGYYCGTSGNRWGGYSRICLPLTSGSRISSAVSTQASCSAAGRDCSRGTGKQCCEDANLDCIMQPSGKAQCSNRNACGGPGSSCKGLGDCCGGLICGSNNRCRVAECRPERSCKAGDKDCNAQRLLECEVMYVGAMGSPVSGQ